MAREEEGAPRTSASPNDRSRAKIIFASFTYGQGGRIVARIPIVAALVHHRFLALRDGSVIDHSDDRHRHISSHHIGIRHTEEQHQSHYVTRPHQCCNIEPNRVN